jgi:hypothetical protein
MNNSSKQSQLIKLRKILDERFSESDLRTLCFDLHVDYQSLPGEGKADKARELIQYLLARQTDGALTALSVPPAGAPGASANTSPSRH